MTRTVYRYNRPYVYPKQQQAIFHNERIGIVEASTKSGKTHGCIIWLFEQSWTTGKPGRNYWWIAPVYSQAKIAASRMKRAIPPSLYRFNETELTMTLLNGAIIQFRSAEKPDTLYGEDVYAAVIDEATRTKDETWTAVRTTLTATRGPVRIIGNVRGRRNWVWKLGRGKSRVELHKITAWDAVDAGILDREEIEAARDDLGETTFRELYEAEPSDDGGNPFGQQFLEKQYLLVPPKTLGTVRAYGVDLGSKVDWTVITGIDEFGQVIFVYRFQDDWENIENTILRIVGRTPTLVDQTGVGDPVVQSLQKKRGSISGYIYTQQSKQNLMESLRLDIQTRQLTWWNSELQDELLSFEYAWTRTGVKYNAPEGMHDDYVNSLALAAKQWHERGSGYWPYDDAADDDRVGDARTGRRTTEMAGIMGRGF